MGLSADRLRTGIEAVAAHDQAVARALQAVGLPQPRIHAPGFAALLYILVSQQLSAKAAATIHGRLVALLGGEPSPATMSRVSDEALRTAGLSRPKVRYSRALAEAVAEGRLNFDRLRQMDDAAAIDTICKVKGLGRWSADIYLLFCEGRPDIWPAGDLALQAALRQLYALEERPEPRDTYALVEPWRPHRGAMAVFLWHFHTSRVDSVAGPGSGRAAPRPSARSRRG